MAPLCFLPLVPIPTWQFRFDAEEMMPPINLQCCNNHPMVLRDAMVMDQHESIVYVHPKLIRGCEFMDQLGIN